MKRKILTMITIGSIFLMALAGCGGSSGNRTTADKATSSDVATTDVAEHPDDSEAEAKIEEESGTETANPVVRKAGLYQSNGSFIPWDDLGIDIEADYTRDNYYTEGKSPNRVFSEKSYNGELVLPDHITSIGVCAFYKCFSLTGIVLPDTLTSIGAYVFNSCSLKSIDLSNTQITSIERRAFDDCTSLTSIDLPDTIISIGENAFSQCESLKSIDLSNTQITSIENWTFDCCRSLTSIDLPNALTRIGEYAFNACGSLTSIDLPDTLTSIEKYAFHGCTSLASIDLPDALTSIGEDAFANTSLTNINYAGTMEEWKAIHKASYWSKDSVLETITCSDGVITL